MNQPLVTGTRLAVAAGLACSAALGAALVAIATADVTTSSPLRPDGGWRVVLVAAVLLAFALYLLGLVLVSRRPPATRIVVAVAVVMQLAPLTAPLLLSTDAYTYWMYGRIASELEGNPYDTPPAQYPSDIAFPLMGSSWRSTTSLYGPAFTLGSEGVATVVGDSPDAAVLAFKAAAAAGMVSIVLLATALAPRPAFAAAFVGWNPLLPLHFAGGGHNDAWMIALVLFGLLLARRNRPQLGGVAWAAAVGTKWVPLVLLPLHLLERRHRGLRLGLAGFVFGLAALGVVATLRYGTAWFSAAGRLSSQARSTGSVGLSDLLRDIGLGHRAILVVLALGFAIAYVTLLVQAWRGRARLGLAAGTFALAQGWLNPWYALWPVALSAIAEDRVAKGLALFLSAYLIRDALPL